MYDIDEGIVISVKLMQLNNASSSNLIFLLSRNNCAISLYPFSYAIINGVFLLIYINFETDTELT